jgi:hypothetical protein
MTCQPLNEKKIGTSNGSDINLVIMLKPLHIIICISNSLYSGKYIKEIEVKESN